MARTAIAILQPVWDCRWSSPGHRLTGVADRLQPESAWTCVRERQRRMLAEDECNTCPHWELGPGTSENAVAATLHVESRVPIATGEIARVSLRAVLVLIALICIAIGAAVLTGPLAMPLTIGLWMGAAAMLGLAVFWRPAT